MKIKLSIVVITALIISSAINANAQRQAFNATKKENLKWYRNAYYYGPDGYYARCKKQMETQNTRPSYNYYPWSKRKGYQTFKQARYNEDATGRAYLSSANLNK